jgi:hypothetical protein
MIKAQNKRQNQQARQFKSLIDNLVLIRAATLDDWSSQIKKEQNATCILRARHREVGSSGLSGDMPLKANGHGHNTLAREAVL